MVGEKVEDCGLELNYPCPHNLFVEFFEKLISNNFYQLNF